MAEQVNKFYIYYHINPLKNEIFYVGKGFGNRAYTKSYRNKHWHNTVNKYGYIIDIVEENLSEDDAFKLEKFYINKIGRRDLDKGTLVNMTDGGEGPSGLKWSDESKEKRRIIQLGRKISKKTKEKMSIANLGKNLKGRSVIDDNTGIIYQSIREASRFINMNEGTLWNQLTGRRKNKTNLRIL